MQPKLLLAILVLTLSACATLTQPDAPKAPNVELGVIDYPNLDVIVNMTGKTQFRQMREIPTYTALVQALVMDGNRVPLASYDRSIAFKPKYWQQVQDYINALVRYINNHCQAGQ